MVIDPEKHWAGLAQLNPFVLDNSLRETVVGNTRAQTVEQKRRVFDLVASTGLKEVILGSFGRHPRTDDFFVEHLHAGGLVSEGHYIFAEVFDQVLDGVPSPVKTRGMINAENYGIRNLIVELDVNTPKFDAWGGIESIKNLCTLRCSQFRQQRVSRHLFFNIRDFPSAMRQRPQDTLEIVQHLALLSKEIRPFGIMVEEPTGETIPYLFGDWIARVRETAVSHHWPDMELLVHVHKGFGLSETIALEALARGATGLWAGLCDTGVGVGHNSSLLTLTNLARMGNQHVLERFNLSILRDVAKEIYELATLAPVPDTAEIFSDRAFDMIFNGGFGHEHKLARLFGASARFRISELADERMIFQRLTELRSGYPWDHTITSLMAIEMQDYLRFNASIDLDATPSLILRYITAGGSVSTTLLGDLSNTKEGSEARGRWNAFRSMSMPRNGPPAMSAEYFLSATDHHAPEHWNFQIDPASALCLEEIYLGNDSGDHHSRDEREELMGSLWTWSIVKRYGSQTDASLESLFVSQLIIPEYLRLHNRNDRSIHMADIKVPADEADHPLLFALPAHARDAVFAQVATTRHQAGTIVCRLLDPGVTFYKVISGRLAAYQDADCKSQIEELGEGRFFGELAAFTGRLRSASVKALSDVVLLSIPSPLAILCAGEREAFQREIQGIIEIYETWYLSKKLRGLPLSSFITMLRFSEIVDVEPGTRLLKKGDGLRGLYIIVHGTADVHPGAGETIPLGAGEVFGEMSILDGTYANADVVTRTACRLARFTPEAAQDMIRADARLSDILEAIADLRKSNKKRDF